MPINTQPYPFQWEGVHGIDEFCGRALLADEMGLGKSLSALLWLWNHKEIQLTVVICPASLKWHWKREARNHFGFRSHILEGRSANGSIPSKGIIIINYDILEKWIPVILDMNPDLLIMDEVHMVSNPDTKRTKACRRLARACEFVLGLSGTPFTNRPGELWSILNMIRPDLYSSRFAFGLEYCSPSKERGKWTYKGAVRLKKLHKELSKNLMIRRRLSDVFKDLPQQSRHVVPFGLSAKDRAEYDFAEGDFANWIKTYDPKKKHSERMEALVKVGYLLRLTARLKLPSVQEWIDNYFQESDEKLIVFGIHKNILGELEQTYKRMCVKVDGSVIGQKRQQLFDAFNLDDNVQLFLGNIKAAGTGWSATKTSTVMFCEFAWTPGTHSQAEKRVRGIKRGTGKPTRSFYLVAEGTIEEDLCELLQKKSKDFDTVIDNGQVVKEDQMVLFDALMEKLKRRLR